MPQLDTSTYSSQIFWLFSSFAFLYFMLKLKIIPLFDDLRQKRWENIEGTKEAADRFEKEGEEINREWKKLLEDARKKSGEILSKSDHDAKSYYANGRNEFLNSMQTRLSKTKSMLAKQESEVEKNILEGIAPLTVDIVVRSSGNILSKNKVDAYLKDNLSSLKKNLDFRSKNV
jgi:F-type H+-transporting ATPase subunit b